MKNHKHFVIVMILVVLSCFLSGCTTTSAMTSEQSTPQEQPHLYWKDIPVTVTNIDKRTWFAGTKWYEVTISVHSDTYNLDETITEKGSGLFNCPKSWNYETGDVITAELYTWKIDSTDEITKPCINKIY